jgi:hypothetical protein
MAAFLDGCRFNPTAGGTTDWTYSSAVTGYQSPAAAGVVNGTLYKYRAESADLSQWEMGQGAYNTSTGVLARTTVLFNSSATGAASGQSGAGTKINFSTTPQVAIVAIKEDLISVEEANAFTTAQMAQARANIGVSGPNLIINGDFRVNQRVYPSGATLAAGKYGHDRWKAGASGGDYSFTQLAGSTMITVAASKTQIQVVKAGAVAGGSYILSWSGTCQARVGLNTATPSGAYASSPVLITGQTAGTTMSVEFGNGAASGTLGTVKLEPGAVATPFLMIDFEDQLRQCEPYYCKSLRYSIAPADGVSGISDCFYGLAGVTLSTSGLVAMTGPIKFPRRMIAVPTITFYRSGLTGTSIAGRWAVFGYGGSAAWSDGTAATVTLGLTESDMTVNIANNGSYTGSNQPVWASGAWTAEAEL